MSDAGYIDQSAKNEPPWNGWGLGWGQGGVVIRVMLTLRVVPEHDERINQQALILIRRLMLV
jgi:hypothetical protein